MKRRGIILKESGVPRDGYKILSEKGDELGILTSGCYSPILKAGIGMGYLPFEIKETGTPLFIQIRNRQAKAELTDLPFVPHRYYK